MLNKYAFTKIISNRARKMYRCFKPNQASYVFFYYAYIEPMLDGN